MDLLMQLGLVIIGMFVLGFTVFVLVSMVGVLNIMRRNRRD